MSYGQPCRRITGWPSAGPASAYPTFSSPASICFRGAKDVLAPGLIAGTVGWDVPDCAFAAPIIPSRVAAIVRAAVLTKRRRSCLRSFAMMSLRFESTSGSSSTASRRSLDQRDERLPFFDDIRGELRPVAGADVLHPVDRLSRDEEHVAGLVRRRRPALDVILQRAFEDVDDLFAEMRVFRCDISR